MSPALIHALDHPIRRQVLRVLDKQGQSQSPVELTTLIAAPLSNLSYHTTVLSDLGVIRQTRTEYIRGATKHFYASEVATNKHVVSILKETEGDDRKLHKGSR